MIEQILRYLELAGMAISVVAVAVIVGGFALAAARYSLHFRELSRSQNFARFKIDLGRALILGLEILIFADVIETITVTPTFQSLAFLASIVVVRTAVSWTLTLEIEGRWPWQPPVAEEQGHA
ncbi:MAG: DUF1622 domain-containing protein [Gammaproteobacteria bacterium]|nr:DUF1622 domain-containing protein [Gammaproteobacteria bacterium]MDX2461400.1 DUF1622 domain-containing protein [Gammaproteobacteria bacterium]